MAQVFNLYKGVHLQVLNVVWMEVDEARFTEYTVTFRVINSIFKPKSLFTQPTLQLDSVLVKQVMNGQCAIQTLLHMATLESCTVNLSFFNAAKTTHLINQRRQRHVRCGRHPLARLSNEFVGQFGLDQIDG